MGCCISKSGYEVELSDPSSCVFRVSKVDDNGVALWDGLLGLTRTELTLYRKNLKPTRWPLKHLRQYGFETELFSFVVGRRCPTGEGNYVFKCRCAENLFQTLDSYVKNSSVVDDCIIWPHSPSTTTIPPLVPTAGHSSSINESYSNSKDTANANESNVNQREVLPNSLPIPPIQSNNALNSIQTYENVAPGKSSSPATTTEFLLDDNKQNSNNDDFNYIVLDFNRNQSQPPEPVSNAYANIELETNRKQSQPVSVSKIYANIEKVALFSSNSLPVINPTTVVIRRSASASSTTLSVSPVLVPDSPQRKAFDYVTIDFEKTKALSDLIGQTTEFERPHNIRHGSTDSSQASDSVFELWP